MIVPIEFHRFLTASFDNIPLSGTTLVAESSAHRVGLLLGCAQSGDAAFQPKPNIGSTDGYSLVSSGQSTLRISWLEHGPLVQYAWYGLNVGGNAMAPISQIALPERYWPALLGKIPLDQLLRELGE